MSPPVSLESAPVPPVAEDDHVRGHGPLVIVYGDYECPYCARADLLLAGRSVKRVFRHFPVVSKHPRARVLAHAAEAAALQGAFWEMHDLLLDHQDALHPRDLIGYAASLGLDTERFSSDLRKHVGMAHVNEDLESADLSNVSGTPTFFINGYRFNDTVNYENLIGAVRAAAEGKWPSVAG